MMRRVGATTLWALRAYRGSTLLLVAACAAGLAAALPVARLVAIHGSGLAPTVALPPTPDMDYGLAWSAGAQGPAAVGREAVSALVNLLGGVALGVLAVAGLTILSISTARADAREVEVAVRRAVGASQRVLFGTLLLEGACVVVAGLALGGGAGLAISRVAIAAWPGGAGAPALLPSLLAGAALVAALMLGALFPLIFARLSSQIAVAESTPVGLAIPSLQLGLSLTVLALASLLNRAATVVPRRVDAHTGPGLVFAITPRDTAPAVRAASYAALLRRLERDPTVAVASLGNPGGLVGMGEADNTWTDFRDCTPGSRFVSLKPCRVTYYIASADTFTASGLHVLAGRALMDTDDWAAPRVAVISRSLAPPLQPGAALGRTILVGYGLPTPYTVVGVVDDRQPIGIGSGYEPPFAVYLSVLQHPASPAELVVRARGGSPGAANAARAAVAASFASPGPALAATTESALFASATAPLRWFETVFAGEGWALLAIATLGTFAMMWLWVSSLLGEVGIRRAVGARRRRIILHVLSRALFMAVGGVAFGSWLGMMLWDALSGIVAGLPSWEPGTVARLAAVLAVSAVAGAWIPAHRATHASPTRLLSS